MLKAVHKACRVGEHVLEWAGPFSGSTPQRAPLVHHLAAHWPIVVGPQRIPQLDLPRCRWVVGTRVQPLHPVVALLGIVAAVEGHELVPGYLGAVVRQEVPECAQEGLGALWRRAHGGVLALPHQGAKVVLPAQRETKTTQAQKRKKHVCGL